MPQISGDFVPSIMPQGQIAPQRIEASPADFGGQVGATLQQASGQEMQLAQQEQRLNNETAVNDVINNELFPAFQSMYQKYYSLQGKDAVDQVGDYQRSMRDMVQQYRSALPNQIQQQIFDQQTGRQLRWELAGMGRYADQQNKIWQAQTMQASIDRDISLTTDKYNDPEMINQGLQSTAKTISKYGQLTGMGPDQISQLQKNAWNKLYSAVLGRSIAAGDANSAVDIFQDGVKRGFISGNAETKMMEVLGPQISQARMTGAVNSLTLSYGLNSPDGNFTQAYQDAVDPEKAAAMGLTTVEQRNFVANTISGMGSRMAKQAANQQADVDDGFLRGVYLGKVGAQQIANYKDPTTGIAPSTPAIEKALRWENSDDRMKNRTDINVYADLRNKILNGQITDPREITPYYGHGLGVTAGNDLTTLVKTMGDPQKNPYFQMALKSYDTLHKDDHYSWDPSDAMAAANAMQGRNNFIIGLARATDKDGHPLTGPAILEKASQMMKAAATPTDAVSIKGPLSAALQRGQEGQDTEATAGTPQIVGMAKGTLHPVYKLQDGSYVADSTKQPALVGTDRQTGQPVYRLPDGRLVTTGGGAQ